MASTCTRLALIPRPDSHAARRPVCATPRAAPARDGQRPTGTRRSRLLNPARGKRFTRLIRPNAGQSRGGLRDFPSLGVHSEATVPCRAAAGLCDAPVRCPCSTGAPPQGRVARASLSCRKRLTRRPSRATGPGRGGGETARARLGVRRIAPGPSPENERPKFSSRIPFCQSDPGPCAAAQPPERVYLGRKLPPTGTRLHHRFPGPPGAPPPEIRKAPAMASTQRPHGGGPAWEET